MRDIAGAREPAAAIAIVADDLTGAADTGAAFAGAGLSTLVTWAADGLADASRRADALAIDAGTRPLDAAGAAAATTGIVRVLRTAGVEQIYKKGDSLLRGHIGVETAAMLDSWQQGAVAIVAFAFPDAGRTTLHGCQHADGLAAGRGVEIAPLLERAGVATGVIELEGVRDDDLGARLRDAAQRCRAIVCDATTTADLSRIVEAAERLKAPVLWAGSGGLARAVAASMRSGPRSRREVDTRVRRGPVMMVCGSASSVVRGQIATAVAAGVAAVEVPGAALGAATSPEGRLGAANQIDRALNDGRDVIVFPTAPEGEIDPAVARGLGDLVAPLARRVGGAVLTGGDTAAAVLRAWGITGLWVLAEVEAGVPIAISEGAQRIAVVTKAGAFGSREVLVEARLRVRALLERGQERESEGRRVDPV